MVASNVAANMASNATANMASNATANMASNATANMASNATANTVSKKKSNKNKVGGLIGWITQYDSLVVFGGMGIALMATIIFTGLFQAGPMIRSNILYNAVGGIMLAITFIWLIFKFMGSQVVVFGKSFDVGMVVYIGIVCFVIFILGN
jgi:hypothetical protein